MQLLLIGTALRSSNLTYMRATAVSNLTKWTSEIVSYWLHLNLRWSYLNLGLEYMSSLKKSASDIVSWVASRWVSTLGTVVCVWLTSTHENIHTQTYVTELRDWVKLTNFEFGGASADGSWRLGFIRVCHTKLNWLDRGMKPIETRTSQALHAFESRVQRQERWILLHGVSLARHRRLRLWLRNCLGLVHGVL